MNKKTTILVIITVISFISTMSLLFFTNKNKYKTPSESSSLSPKYIIKYYEGEVTLFNNESVLERFDGVNFDLLPTEDKLLLEEGIVVSSIADAHSLIEDYDG